MQDAGDTFDLVSSLDDPGLRHTAYEYKADHVSDSSDTGRELYTVSNYSGWFFWDEIHELERQNLKEFFDGSSISRTPKIYKEYRDFIINKYREDPARRLTFTELRKMLIGDVSLIHKVYQFLDGWGLINFQSSVRFKKVQEEAHVSVVVEEGLPPGIRVFPSLNAAKNSSFNRTVERANDKFKFPPLTSYVDVFTNPKAVRDNGIVGSLPSVEVACKNCSEDCHSSHYVCEKGDFVICENCFKNGNYGEGRSALDFLHKDCAGNTGSDSTDSWSDVEIQLLLEGAIKFGDDWEQVASHVKTKSKHSCILKLIELPPGDHTLDSLNYKNSYRISDVKETIAAANDVTKNGDQQNEHSADPEAMPQESFDARPTKRCCLSPLANAGTSLVRQVASLSTMVGPSVAVAAAESAIAALCDEHPSAEILFHIDEEEPTLDFGSNGWLGKRRVKCDDTFEMVEGEKQSDTFFPCSDEKMGSSMLHMRAAVATALGAAAANAKLLADQEDREIEHLVSTIIDRQIKKIECKVKHFEELELIMDKEYTCIQTVKDSVLSMHLDILQKNLASGASKGSNTTHVKPLIGLLEAYRT